MTPVRADDTRVELPHLSILLFGGPRGPLNRGNSTDPRKIWLASWRPGDSMSLKLKAPAALLDAISTHQNHCGRVLGAAEAGRQPREVGEIRGLAWQTSDGHPVAVGAGDAFRGGERDLESIVAQELLRLDGEIGGAAVGVSEIFRRASGLGQDAIATRPDLD